MIRALGRSPIIDPESDISLCSRYDSRLAFAREAEIMTPHFRMNHSTAIVRRLRKRHSTWELYFKPIKFILDARISGIQQFDSEAICRIVAFGFRVEPIAA